MMGVEDGSVSAKSVPAILIVEEDAALLDAWVALMAAAGYRVTGVTSFAEGRRAMSDSTPDVLLTDVRLGAYNGLQLVIRARAANPRLRSIVVTGFPDPVVRREAEALDARHLEKPVDLDELRSLVASVLADSAD
jgi:DNA-binding NtrC family response regulator